MRTSAQQILKLSKALGYLEPGERDELAREVLKILPGWTPLVGPQLEAYNSPADILYFGGAAGGSKSDLLLGLALNAHRRSIIFRRESLQVDALVDRLVDILGSRKQIAGKPPVCRLKGRQIEFGSCSNPGEELKWSGRPHDFIGFDEIPLFLRKQFTLLLTWLRSTIPGQRCRVVCTGNPPLTADGRWVIDYWGPWLDPKHPRPAMPGELRWYTTIDGKDVELPDGKSFYYKNELITPMSRTFIPSSVDDNPFLMQTGYKRVLEAHPEPLRSQMLMGDFQAGIKDSENQLIPTAWVEAAMARWRPEDKQDPMDSMGVDPSRGGDDTFEIARRYGYWYAPLISYPGREFKEDLSSTETPGAKGASKVILARRDQAPVHTDVIGIGSSVYDHLSSNGVHVIAINGAKGVPDWEVDKRTQTLRFRNYRALLYWRFMESLDPSTENGQLIQLPPDPELKADLCAPLFQLTPGGILVESKEDKIGPSGVKISGIKTRLGRSPNKGDAVVYASVNTPKRRTAPGQMPKDPNLAKSYAVKFNPL